MVCEGALCFVGLKGRPRFSPPLGNNGNRNGGGGVVGKIAAKVRPKPLWGSPFLTQTQGSLPANATDTRLSRLRAVTVLGKNSGGTIQARPTMHGVFLKLADSQHGMRERAM